MYPTIALGRMASNGLDRGVPLCGSSPAYGVLTPGGPNAVESSHSQSAPAPLHSCINEAWLQSMKKFERTAAPTSEAACVVERIDEAFGDDGGGRHSLSEDFANLMERLQKARQEASIWLQRVAGFEALLEAQLAAQNSDIAINHPDVLRKLQETRKKALASMQRVVQFETLLDHAQAARNEASSISSREEVVEPSRPRGGDQFQGENRQHHTGTVSWQKAKGPLVDGILVPLRQHGFDSGGYGRPFDYTHQVLSSEVGAAQAPLEQKIATEVLLTNEIDVSDPALKLRCGCGTKFAESCLPGDLCAVCNQYLKKLTKKQLRPCKGKRERLKKRVDWIFTQASMKPDVVEELTSLEQANKFWLMKLANTRLAQMRESAGDADQDAELSHDAESEISDYVCL